MQMSKLPLVFVFLILIASVLTSFRTSFDAESSDDLQSLPDTAYVNQQIKLSQDQHDATNYEGSLEIIEALIASFPEEEMNELKDTIYWDLLVNCYAHKAEALRAMTKLEEAQIPLNKALELGEQWLHPKNYNIGRAYGILGIIYFNKNEYKKALGPIQKGLDIRKAAKGDMDQDLFYSYNNKASCYFRLGDLTEAEENFNKALEVANYQGWDENSNVALVYINLAAVSGMRRRITKVVEFAQNGVDILLKINNEKYNNLLAGGYAILGRGYRDIGEFDKSLAFLEKARIVYENKFGANSIGVANQLLAMGQVYDRLDKSKEAIDCYLSALQIQKAFYKGENDKTADSYEAIGKILLKEDRLEEAREKAIQAYQIRKNKFGEEHTAVAASYGSLAKIAIAEQNYDQAESNAKNALAINRTAHEDGVHPSIASNYLQLAEIEKERGNLEASFEFVKAALGSLLGEEQKNKVLSSLSLVEIGDFSLLADIVFFEASLKKQAYLEQFNQNAFNEAIAAYQNAFDYVRSVRQRYDFASSKTFILQKAIPAYEELINMYWQAYERSNDAQLLNEMYVLNEETSSVLLMDAIQETAAKSFSGIPESIQEREAQLKIDLSYYEERIYKEKQKGEKANQDQINDWKTIIFELQTEYEDLLSLIGEKYPEYYNLKYQEHQISLKEVQNFLPNANTLLVDYYLGDTTLIVFGITKDQVHINYQKVDDLLFQQIKELRTMISSPPLVSSDKEQELEFYAFSNTARSLYSQLLDNTIQQFKAEELIILPHGALGYIPFHILLASEPTPEQKEELYYRGLDYLFRTYRIRYEYAASLLIQEQVSNKGGHGYLGFAPKYQDNEEGTSEPRGDQEETEDQLATLIEDASNLEVQLNEAVRGPLSPLLFNQPEVKEVAALFKTEGYLAQEASEMNFKERAEKAQVLHLAMHTLLNDEDPLYSQLVFTEEGEDGEDGYLNAYELYNMKLKADLAVLSACNTGIGKMQKGEGIMSLSRAFKYAGCSNIVMSLWPANDASTKEIMVDFFKRLKAGEAKDQALRNARTQYLDNASNTHPFYWATFVFIGDNAPLSGARLFPSSWLILLLPVGLFLYWLVRRQAGNQ